MCFLVSPIGGFLRQKKMSLFSNEHCAATFDGEREELPFEVPYQPVFNPDIHVCAGLESGIGGSCFVSLPHHLSRIHLQHITFCHFIFFSQGDSGGALACEDEHGNWLAYGIVSFGSSGLFCTDLSVYARTETYLQFIDDVIESHDTEE